jgi:hypothetical protein
MSIKILVLQYSQTGQVTRIVHSITQPLENQPGIQVIHHEIQPPAPYPFPWSLYEFLDVMPESIYQDPPDTTIPADLINEQFDLVLIGYSVWFLSPCLPVMGILKAARNTQLLNNTPVVTIIGCRDMWIMAQEKMKRLLEDAGADLIGNIVLMDRGGSTASFVTTPRWLLTGKKDSFWGLPPAGVSEKDILEGHRFGRAIMKTLLKDGKPDISMLQGLKAIERSNRFLLGEKIGQRSFKVWGWLIRKAGRPGSSKRRFLLTIYIIYLALLIMTLLPIALVLQIILKPLLKKRTEELWRQYEQPSGSADDRMSEFTD